MTSYRNGKPTGYTKTRLAGGVMLGAAAAAAAFANRSERTVKRHCQPIGCDVGTRADVYDLDAVVAQLAQIPTRRKTTAA